MRQPPRRGFGQGCTTTLHLLYGPPQLGATCRHDRGCRRQHVAEPVTAGRRGSPGRRERGGMGVPVSELSSKRVLLSLRR
jgi:hypothetical protein